MIVHEREENIRIKISHPHARVMSPNHGFRGDIRQMYCQAGGGPLHYQATMRSCEGAELGALYLIMRQPNIDLQQLSAFVLWYYIPSGTTGWWIVKSAKELTQARLFAV